jgi:hypothetical protein
MVEFVGGYAAAVPDVTKDDVLGYNLVEGGQIINSAGGEAKGIGPSSSGFAVQNGYGPFILTAGHAVGSSPACNGVGDTWYQGNVIAPAPQVVLGIASACEIGGAYDVGAISTYGYRNNYQGVHWTQSDYVHPVTFNVGTNNLIGQTVCNTGYVTTGVNGNSNLTARCGIVWNLNGNPNYSFAQYPMTASFGSSNYACDHGDSGAAIVWPTGYGFGAAGIHSGHSGIDCWFTRFNLIADHWGLSLSP